jgi:hypothetical protein
MLRTVADIRPIRQARETQARRGRKERTQALAAAEDRFHARLKKLARFAIVELSMGHEEFVTRAAEWHLLLRNYRQTRVKKSAGQIGEERWEARLKRLKHQEELAKRRKH